MKRINETGYSFVESLLAITIFFMLASLFVPRFIEMEKELEKQKVEAHAAEVAFNAARMVRDYGITSGTIEIEHISYNWVYKSEGICVNYIYLESEREQCVGKK